MTLHNQTEPVQIQVSIKDDAKYENKKEVTVNDDQPKLVSLHIGEDIEPNGNYKLVAEGLSGLVFKNESSLHVEKKNVSLFIQTDKAIYKPGETIRFRVLVLDALLRPANVKKGELLVYISVRFTPTLYRFWRALLTFFFPENFQDGQNNRIKQWKDVELVKGVFGDELQLSAQPLLGDWSIVAEVDTEVWFSWSQTLTSWC